MHVPPKLPFLSAVLKRGVAVPPLCHPPLPWGSETQLGPGAAAARKEKLPQARLTEEQNS